MATQGQEEQEVSAAGNAATTSVASTSGVAKTKRTKEKHKEACLMHPQEIEFMYPTVMKVREGSAMQTRTGEGAGELKQIPSPIEVSVHSAPKALLRELNQVFPTLESDIACLETGKEATSTTEPTPVLAVLTAQNSDVDLADWGETAAFEKDRLLEVFMAWAAELRTRIIAEGYWCDYIDPCSGLPKHSDSNTVYRYLHMFWYFELLYLM